MPSYDEWVALVYSLWYQPVQINLAYTMFQIVQANSTRIPTDKWNVNVHDFGSGQLAMRFGMALAAADAISNGHDPGWIDIEEIDPSQSMIDLGQKIWIRFLNESAGIERYPELDPLRQAYQRVVRRPGMHIDADDDASMRWLTVMHVAYKENSRQVKETLDNYIQQSRPDLVLVTSHANPNSIYHSYSPADQGFDCLLTGNIGGDEFLLRGEFDKVTELRARWYDDRIADVVSEERQLFAEKYLTHYPTEWSGIGSARYSVWIDGGGDDLPF